MKNFKSVDGKEFTIKRENIINPKTGEQMNIATGKNPIVNIQGKQVEDPIAYEYFPDINPNQVLESENPYLFFGSEFENHVAIPLPTPYSDNINYTGSILNNAVDPGRLNVSPELQAAIENSNIDIIQKIIYKELMHSIVQNVLAIYNNNLRMILAAYLKKPEYESKLYLFNDVNQNLDSTLGLYSHFNICNTNQFVKINEDNSDIAPTEPANRFFLSINLIKIICSNISNVYYSLINGLMNGDYIDFQALGISKAPQNVPAEYMYSYGVDVVNEIANMECSIISNIVEMNVMNACHRYTDIVNNIINK